MSEASKQVSKLHFMENGLDSSINHTTSPSQASQCSPHVVGFKKKPGIMTKKRFKSFELQGKKRKGATTKDSQVQ